MRTAMNESYEWQIIVGAAKLSVNPEFILQYPYNFFFSGRQVLK
jgi:hypothetical protein